VSVSLSIDMHRCQVYAQCVRAVPEVFTVTTGGNLQVTYPEAADGGARAEQLRRLRRAARVCPTRAITVQADDDDA
jgi:ferredoxin